MTKTGKTSTVTEDERRRRRDGLQSQVMRRIRRLGESAMFNPRANCSVAERAGWMIAGRDPSPLQPGGWGGGSHRRHRLTPSVVAGDCVRFTWRGGGVCARSARRQLLRQKRSRGNGRLLKKSRTRGLAHNYEVSVTAKV